jgi:hypothetical protein
MNEDAFNMSIRKFLKKVGVTSQREIESAVRSALDSGELASGAPISAKVTLRLETIGHSVDIEGTIETE